MGRRFPSEDQSVKVTTAATCRAAAPRRAFVLVFVVVKAPPPVWGRGERGDVGRPAPRLLLLLLETQMGMEQEASNVGSEATVPPFTTHPASRGHPALRSFTPGEGPRAGHRGEPQLPPKGTPAQPEDGRAGPTAILYLGFETIRPPLPV